MPLSAAHQRGLRMAARVAGAVALAGAAASTAYAKAPIDTTSTLAGEDSAAGEERSSHHDDATARAGEVLRIQPGFGSCMPRWGPPAPPALDARELAALERALS